MPRLPEELPDALEALGLGCEAKPEHRSPSKVEPQSRAAIAAAIDRIGSGAAVVKQDRDITGASNWSGVVQQIGERRPLHFTWPLALTNEPSRVSLIMRSCACVGVSNL